MERNGKAVMKIKWGSVSWCDIGSDFTAGEVHVFAHTAVTLFVCKSIIKALYRQDSAAGKWIHSRQGQKTYKAFRQSSVVFGKNV